MPSSSSASSSRAQGGRFRKGRLLAALAVVALALAPALAEARAGRGSSLGSRGARTYQAPPPTQTAPQQARPVERSMTETTRNPAATPAGAAATAPMGAAAGGSWLSRNPLMGGLMGGFLGAGLFGLLSGSGLFGGMGGFLGFLGLLLQIGLVVLLVRFALRFFRNGGFGRPAMAGAGASAGASPHAPPQHGMARNAAIDLPPQGARAGAGGGPSPQPGVGPQHGAGAPLALGPEDFQVFEERLHGVQAAWSNGDLRALGRLATPEMLQYFSEQLSDDASRGVRNEVTEVKLEQGDLSESWAEGSRHFATVAMRWSAIDLDRDASTGAVVSGDPAQRTEAVELWTFLRAGAEGAWMLSAIQQTGEPARR